MSVGNFLFDQFVSLVVINGDFKLTGLITYITNFPVTTYLNGLTL